MSQSFQFDGYTVRPLAEGDRPYLDFLIEQDEYHQGRMTADFFLKREQGEDAWALEDEHGQIVFYFKTTTAVRLAIQFRPSSSPADRLRNAAAMMKGLRWIEGVLRSNGFREMVTRHGRARTAVFPETSPWLRGRAATHASLSGSIHPPKTPPEAVGTVPTTRLERLGDAHVRT